MDEIEKEKIIIVEGNDDEEFIKKFLEFEEIEDFQVINLGGKKR